MDTKTAAPDPSWNRDLSNFNRHLNMTIVAWSPGQVSVALEMGDHMRNRTGLLHGGVTATLIDAAAGYAGCFCTVPGNVRRAATLSLTTNFLAPGKGPRVIAHAKALSSGKRSFNATIEVNDADGTLIAIGQAVYQYFPGSEAPEGSPRKSE